MRALILAAGLGTRMQPLTQWRAKPALPVRGVPVIAYLLRLLAHHGVVEVMINLHHHAESLRKAVEEYCPAGLHVHFVEERERPLGTGGAIRNAATFLRESDPSLVLAGDMLLDLDLRHLVALHRSRGDRITLGLRKDSREAIFGTIGIGEDDRVRRIGSRFDLGSENSAGLFVSVRVLAAAAFDTIPDRECFEDLTDWIAPELERRADDIRGLSFDPRYCVWEPVGTPAEYLHVNLDPISLSFMDSDALGRAHGTRIEPGLIVGAGAQIGQRARLERCVVWDGERVPPGLQASDGVFAGGKFHSVAPQIGESRKEVQNDA